MPRDSPITLVYIFKADSKKIVVDWLDVTRPGELFIIKEWTELISPPTDSVSTVTTALVDHARAIRDAYHRELTRKLEAEKEMALSLDAWNMVVASMQYAFVDYTRER